MNQRPAPVPGAVLFARYAYPPNSLDLCGPSESAGLWQAAVQGTDLDYLSHLASQFEGAWPYLQMIAAANGIDDPLDARVVESYWLGNELSLRVPLTTLARSLEERFAWRAGRSWDALVAAAVAGGVAHHSFHVFAVYPWLGLLRAGREGPAMDVLDNCRIRPGRLVALEGDQALVSSRPLRFLGSRLEFGATRTELVRYRRDDHGLVDDLRVGDAVALHWDWICDRLSEGSARWLDTCTRRNLQAVNSLTRPGPAVICGA